ncbi:MAG: hypothetical protein REH78_00055 [Cellulomonas sp.]|nr:hypothetical protein [Cellulomonas sp.]
MKIKILLLLVILIISCKKSVERPKTISKDSLQKFLRGKLDHENKVPIKPKVL